MVLMKKNSNYIEQCILDSIKLKNEVLLDKNLLEKIEDVAIKCIELYKEDNKLLLAGNGGSAADAQHIAAELVGRYLINRPALAAIALTTDTSNLTAIGNDFGYDKVFSRQIEGIGRKGDIFIGISTSGNSVNIVNAINVAKEKGIYTVALCGRDGGEMAKIADCSLVVSSEDTPRIQEVHILIGHIICGIIENCLFEKYNE